MSNNSVVKSSAVLGISFTILAMVASLASCGEAVAENTASTTPAAPAVLPSSIAAEVLKYTNAPMRGTVYYYCDCGTGHDSGCVAGKNSNPGTDPTAPKQTFASAISQLNGLTGTSDVTISFCKGGAFDLSSFVSVTHNRCTAGTECTDLREYASPVFTSSAKPLINSAAHSGIFNFSGVVGGVRVLNLFLQGHTNGTNDSTSGVFYYQGAHNITFGNVTIDNFAMGAYLANNPDTIPCPDITMTGNTITNNYGMGFLGAADRTNFSYNHLDGNGGTDGRSHSIYLSAHKPADAVLVEGNYIHGQYGATCSGAMVAIHGLYTGMQFNHNVISVEESADSDGCWGVGFGPGGYPAGGYSRNSVYDGNTIINTGNNALPISSSPDAIIRNNLIIFTAASVAHPVAITVGNDVARTSPADDKNTRNTVANNTIWFGPKVSGATGITVKNEGTGHILANNTVTYENTSSGNGMACYNYQLGLSAYSFINNNHCYSAAATPTSLKWEATRGTIESWKKFSALYGFDTASIKGPAKLTTFDGTNFTTAFKPGVGSPLLKAGDLAHGSTTDISGKPRPTPPATKPAIGAREP